jgi:cytochrome bd-type quinol oxidase subunit 2
VPTFWAIFDIPKRRFASHKEKMIWLMTVSTLPFVGAVLYILFKRRHTEPMEIPE